MAIQEKADSIAVIADDNWCFFDAMTQQWTASESDRSLVLEGDLQRERALQEWTNVEDKPAFLKQWTLFDNDRDSGSMLKRC